MSRNKRDKNGFINESRDKNQEPGQRNQFIYVPEYYLVICFFLAFSRIPYHYPGSWFFHAKPFWSW